MKLAIEKVNWPKGWPHQPQTNVIISRTEAYLVVHYTVVGDYIRAVATQDQQAVWEDSCVEFFCQVPGEDTYMNFETNCIGTMVASRRRSRTEGVVPFTPEQMATIVRQTSLERGVAITDCDGDASQWEVEIHIPWTLILGENVQPTFPLTLKANFYKCGDKTRLPHFVSWQPILTQEPDFHRPEFFGELRVE